MVRIDISNDVNAEPLLSGVGEGGSNHACGNANDGTSKGGCDTIRVGDVTMDGGGDDAKMRGGDGAKVHGGDGVKMRGGDDDNARGEFDADDNGASSIEDWTSDKVPALANAYCDTKVTPARVSR